MTDRDRIKNAVVSEVETICVTLDGILDNLDRVNAQNAGNVLERLYFSKINVCRALALIYGDEE